ncbi:MAG: hypothetical protein EOP06_04065 [Proteobacteria bacterium]|nr:MAG: hypothetical protein EOP06_04065 [Pseudomonadota bacterium]
MKAVVLSLVVSSMMGSWAQAQTSATVQTPVRFQPKVELQNLKTVRVAAELKLDQLQSPRRGQFKLNVRKGNEGGGGGDPQDIREQTSKKHSSFSEDANRLAEAGQLVEQRQGRERNDKLASRYLAREIRQIRGFAVLLAAADYPFSRAFQETVNFEQLANTLDKARVIEQRNLKLNGKTVTFISFPDTGTLQMDLNRYLEMKVGRHSSWQTVTATVLHEGLRLRNLEASTSYPFSNEYAVALNDLSEGAASSVFWSRVSNSPLITSCAGSASEYASLMSMEPMDVPALAPNIRAVQATALQCANTLIKKLRAEKCRIAQLQLSGALAGAMATTDDESFETLTSRNWSNFAYFNCK